MPRETDQANEHSNKTTGMTCICLYWAMEL